MTPAKKIVHTILDGGLPLLGSVLEVIEQDCGWRKAEELRESASQEIIVRVEARYRWLAYEPNSSHAKRGLAGRWQRMNERGAWETVPAPTNLWRQA